MKTALITASAGCALLTATIAGLAQDSSGDVIYKRQSSRAQAMQPGQAGRRSQPSAVQEQLQQMYERDGRQMPVMDLSRMPTSRTRGSRGRESAESPEGTRPPVAASRGAPAKRSIWSKLVPSFMRRNWDEIPEPETDEGPEPPADQFPYDVPPETARRPSNVPPQYSQRPQYTPEPQRLATPPRTLNIARPAVEQPRAIEPPRPAVQPPRAVPSVDSALNEATLVDDPDEMTDLNESLADPVVPQRAGIPSAERAEQNPFTGITINPSERETQVADEPPVLPDDPPSEELPGLAAPPNLVPGDFDTPELPAEPNTVESSLPEKTGSPFPARDEDELPLLEEVDPDAPLPEPAPKDTSRPLPAVAPTGENTEAVEPFPAISEDIDVPVLRRPAEELPGLKGYCLVTLKNERKLVKGLDEHRSIYQGRIYRFASDEAQEQFEDAPSAFAPALGGRDPLRVAEGATETAGTLDHAVWYKGTLYMFTSQKSLNTFIAAPTRYAPAR